MTVMAELLSLVEHFISIKASIASVYGTGFTGLYCNDDLVRLGVARAGLEECLNRLIDERIQVKLAQLKESL